MSWYKPRTVADVTKRLDQRQRSSFDSPYSKLRTYAPKDGSNAVRILPPSWDPPEHYCYSVWQHKFVGSGNGSYLCLRRMKNQRCPICAEETVARRNGDTELAKQLMAKARRLCYVLNRSKGAEQPNQPLLWDMSDIQDEEILNLTTDEKNSGAIFPEHPEHGYDLSFSRLRMGAEAKNVKYQSWKFDRDHSPISNDPRVTAEIMQWLHEHPIPKMLEWHDAKYLEEIMSGTAAERDDELEQQEDDDEREREQDERRLSRASAHVGEDDEPLPGDDEEEAEEQDDEEEAEEQDDDKDDEQDDDKDDEQDDEEPEEAKVREPELRTRRRLEEPEEREDRRASSNGSRRSSSKPRERSVPSSRRDSSRYRPRD
jgi:hypothetical protein